MSNNELARYGENLAVQEIEKLGYKVIHKNYSCPIGEVDIIAKHNNLLVFIEVKTRKSQLFGTPLEAVDRRKQAKICHIALWYLKEHRLKNISIRFDVVSVLLKNNCDPAVQVVPGAFDFIGAL